MSLKANIGPRVLLCGANGIRMWDKSGRSGGSGGWGNSGLDGPNFF